MNTERRQEYSGTNKLTAIKDAHDEIGKLKDLTIKLANVAAEQGKLLRGFQETLNELSLTLRGMRALANISNDALVAKVEELRITDFDQASKDMDERRGMEICGEVAMGDEAIVSMQFYNQDVEMKDKEILRVRVPTSNPDKLAFLVPTLIDMKVGDIKSIDEGPMKMKVTLIGARRLKL
jgi:hypothetical protein